MKMDELVKTYIQVRAKKSRRKAAYDAEVKPLDELQDKIEALLLQKFGDLGIDSVKTEEGTAYSTVRTSASIADWDVFWGFIQENSAYDMIERRVSKAVIEQFKEANAALPPGINWSETRVVNFRKS